MLYIRRRAAANADRQPYQDDDRGDRVRDNLGDLLNGSIARVDLFERRDAIEGVGYYNILSAQPYQALLKVQERGGPREPRQRDLPQYILRQSF